MRVYGLSRPCVPVFVLYHQEQEPKCFPFLQTVHNNFGKYTIK